MQLPKLIYECYPVLYIISGIGSISLVDSLVAFLSGLALSFGGVTILFLRRNHRAIKRQLAQASAS